MSHAVVFVVVVLVVVVVVVVFGYTYGETDKNCRPVQYPVVLAQKRSCTDYHRGDEKALLAREHMTS